MQLGEKIRIALRISDLQPTGVQSCAYSVTKIKILDFDRTEAL
jgi:hypothetical protein